MTDGPLAKMCMSDAVNEDTPALVGVDAMAAAGVVRRTVGGGAPRIGSGSRTTVSGLAGATSGGGGDGAAGAGPWDAATGCEGSAVAGAASWTAGAGVDDVTDAVAPTFGAGSREAGAACEGLAVASVASWMTGVVSGVAVFVAGSRSATAGCECTGVCSRAAGAGALDAAGAVAGVDCPDLGNIGVSTRGVFWAAPSP